MHRFFCPHLHPEDTAITVTDPQESHHLKNVLRLKKGDQLCLFNGGGGEAVGAVEKINTDKIHIKILSFLEKRQKDMPAIALACAIPKKAKFESIIEKCTELGVQDIYPLLTERTEVRFDRSRLKQKVARYQTVAVNAAKQSQRADLPTIHEPVPFADMIKKILPQETAFIPCLAGERHGFLQALREKLPCSRMIIFIGPEGDFTPQELTLAIESGCIPVTLGPLTLKVDTAAVTAVAAARLVIYEKGDTSHK